MDNYILFYFIGLSLAFYGGVGVFQKYRNLAGLFFFIYIILASFWLIFYFLFFSELPFSISDRLILSRINFGLSPITLFSFLYFIYFFGQTSIHKNLLESVKERWKSIIVFLLTSIFIFYISFFGDGVIQSIILDPGTKRFREVYGNIAWINQIFYILFIPIGWILFQIKKKSLTEIDALRLSKVVLIKLIFLTFLILIQIILPMYGIWIFEYQVIIFFGISALVIASSVRRYYFSPIGYQVSKFISVASGLVTTSLILVYTLDDSWIYQSFFASSGISFLSMFTYVSIVILLYHCAWHMTRKSLFREEDISIEEKMGTIRKEISRYLDINKLRLYIQEKFLQKLPIKELDIFLLQENVENQLYFQNLFEKLHHKILINDTVYLTENNIKCDFSRIQNDVKKIVLCIPIYYPDEKIIQGLFILGEKKYGDFYNSEEIKFIENFSYTLAIQLKYISTYNELKNITENLDKTVADKTLEYNDLINRQKDFIRMISHEIRSPIGSAIFQSDSIIDDIESGEYDKEYIKEELNVLSEQLMKTSEILTKLFSVEYYDVHSVSLFRENIDIYTIFDEEIHIAIKTNPKIHFINAIEKNIGFAFIDKIQFRQVITNLISNAIKFATNEKPTILIEGYKKNGFIEIGIEDNGPGFDGIDTENIFDKYTIGNGSRVGLGMGLYLCKRILEMHSGKIQAQTGSHLGGARFDIIIPIS